MKRVLVPAGIVLGLEVLIMLFIGVIPPSLSIHWVILGIGLGVPAALLLIGIAFGLIMSRLGVQPPSDVDGYLRDRSAIQLHSGLPGSTAHKSNDE